MFVTLKNGSTVEVPAGADPEAFRRAQNRKLGVMSKNTKISKPRRKSGRKANKRTFRADSVLARATVELVNRVNDVAPSTNGSTPAKAG